MISSVLLFAPAEHSRPDRGPAAYAIGLAASQQASLTALVVSLDVTTPGVSSDPATVARAIADAATARRVACETITEHSHAIGIHEVIGDHARTHDLTVTGCDPNGLLSERQMAEYLLFESGRPILIVPADHDGTCSDGPVVVAWDNSRAAARALGDARPLIGARETIFLTIDGDKQIPRELDGPELIRSAQRRGFACSLRNVARRDRSVAAALQDEALAAGASLLVMGGYGHSRLRRFVLGSATSGILEGPRLPVLLSH